MTSVGCQDKLYTIKTILSNNSVPVDARDTIFIFSIDKKPDSVNNIDWIKFKKITIEKQRS